jgi:O-antigen/teichoic acid export membrane protein
MTRTRRFIVNSGSGYAFAATNLAYTVISVPLALHYLGKDEFGLWALSMQIMGYVLLLDLGVTSAISRFLADSKDETSSSAYGSMFAAGALVLIVQGVLIAATGTVFSVAAPALFNIPAELAPTFRNVLVILSCLSGLTIAMRGIGSPLWAFQRLDVFYAMGIVTLVSGLAMLWLGFTLGWGVYSFAVSGGPSAVVCPAATFIICYRNGYYPPLSKCRGFGWPIFRRIFLFGKDILLMALGSQLVGASQVMILSRVAGLETAATFAVGTKLFNMGQQFAGRIIESSAPSLTEIYVRGERALFRARFRDIMAMTVLLSVMFAILIACGNSTVISLWTSGTIAWSRRDDLLLGLLLVLTAATRCMVGLFGVVAVLRPVRSIYFIEACLFVSMAIPAAAHFGITGLLVASLVAHSAITATLTMRASRRQMGDDTSSARLVLQAVGIVTVVFFSIQMFPQSASLADNALRIGVAMLASAAASWFLIMSPSTRTQLVNRARSALCSMHT